MISRLLFSFLCLILLFLNCIKARCLHSFLQISKIGVRYCDPFLSKTPPVDVNIPYKLLYLADICTPDLPLKPLLLAPWLRRSSPTGNIDVRVYQRDPIDQNQP